MHALYRSAAALAAAASCRQVSPMAATPAKLAFLTRRGGLVDRVDMKVVFPSRRGDLSHRVLLASLQGSPEAPRCGFSRKVVDALKGNQIDFSTFDILSDEGIRQGLKEHSNWPTYPQLYVKGELVGGCDIILEMATAGELKSSVEEMMYRKPDA
eukprot:351542-Chlamydomonas_euryale.AAC.2